MNPLLIIMLSLCVAHAQKQTIRSSFPTEECRRCLDHFYNSYYCASELATTGACCPFPETSVGLTKLLNPICIDSPQLGQTCSHKFAASAIGTDREMVERNSTAISSYYVCEHDIEQCGGQYELEIEVPELEAGEFNRSTEWVFKDMRPIFAFCNWKLIVQGFEKDSASTDETLLGLKVTLQMESATQTEFELTAASSTEFKFTHDKETKQFAPMDLIRFAQLDPRLVLAQENRNVTDPMDLFISIYVEKELTEVEVEKIIVEAVPEPSEGAPIIILVIAGSAFAVLLIVLVLTILHYNRKLNFRKLFKRCGKCKACRIRKKKLSPFKLQKMKEKEELQKEIDKSAVEQELRDKNKYKIENQGKNDSFFAGEEFKDFETINPNVDMGFQKFALRPNPDFVVQVITEHMEEEMTMDKTLGGDLYKFNEESAHQQHPSQLSSQGVTSRQEGSQQSHQVHGHGHGHHKKKSRRSSNAGNHSARSHHSKKRAPTPDNAQVNIGVQKIQTGQQQSDRQNSQQPNAAKPSPQVKVGNVTGDENSLTGRPSTKNDEPSSQGFSEKLKKQPDGSLGIPATREHEDGVGKAHFEGNSKAEGNEMSSARISTGSKREGEERFKRTASILKGRKGQMQDSAIASDAKGVKFDL